MRPVWRVIQSENIRSFAALAAELEFKADQLSALDIDPSFPINIPRRLMNKMEKGNIQDPIFLQWAPLKAERAVDPRTSCNPVGDDEARVSERLLHKYEGRVLLVTTSACAMHCRYCFRKEFAYPSGRGYEAELDMIRSNPTIQEAILSGGDPLSLSPKILESLLRALDEIPHLRLIRFHTRFPIGIPERIDQVFLDLLASLQTQVWFNVHINHAREVDADVAAALKRVQKLGIPVLSSSVLLRGVNDTFEAHKELLETLVQQGIIPYYLHQLDRVQGSMHFEVSIEEGLALVAQLRAHLPGYAIPQFVQEIAGEKSKRPLYA